ncbi:uncharacterized protein LOC126686481 [Mercurialis annua]|uniref:uncharacterized protein LOC126686481 n=1 Tax=Mercurialis annua TaxID=3986 RepID=UPI00215E7C10|nr:uncharacterized protein LOC126686481 [Mercurialis annua]
MALMINWYDYICFGIVAVSFICSLWVVWRREFGMARNDVHVQLWSSCCKEVHPAWLLVTRLISFVVMAGFLLWDLRDWGALIFIYYTEYLLFLFIFPLVLLPLNSMFQLVMLGNGLI